MDEDRKRQIQQEEAYRKQLRDEEAKKKQAAGNKGCLYFFLAIVGVFVLLLVYGSLSGGNEASAEEVITRPNGETVDESSAAVLCQRQIRDRLRAPGTAKFAGPFSDDYSRPVKSGNTWSYTVSVDSENAFGAALRSQWSCVLDGADDGIVVRQLE